MKKIIILFVILFSFPEIYSQEFLINLKTGNFSIFKEIYSPKTKQEVSDSNIIIDNKTYLLIKTDNFYSYQARFREDSSYVYYNPEYQDSEYVYFKANLEYGDQWVNVSIKPPAPNMTSVVMDTFTTYIQQLGVQTKIYHIYESFGLIEKTWYWSKEFGVMRLLSEWWDSYCVGAYIDGIAYGDTSYKPVSVETEDLPFSNYSLSQNYPNPFNPGTNIRFSLPEGSITTIKVYDILGEEKATILDEYKPAGSYSATFEAKDLPSGVYIYTITSGSFKQSRKMLLMK